MIFICTIIYRYILYTYVFFSHDYSSTELPPINKDLQHKSVQASCVVRTMSESLSHSRKHCSAESERQPEAVAVLRNCYLVLTQPHFVTVSARSQVASPRAAARKRAEPLKACKRPRPAAPALAASHQVATCVENPNEILATAITLPGPVRSDLRRHSALEWRAPTHLLAPVLCQRQPANSFRLYVKTGLCS